MYDLQLFRSPDLTGDDGQRCLSVLSHPKRLALLAFLATETPGGFHSRDRLLGLLWPESDAEHARNSLRQSLYFLRRRLPVGTLVNRGECEVFLDSSLLRCDVVEFEESLDAGDPEKALELYAGDLLEGFFIPGAAPFEQWVENKRSHLRRRAIAAAWQLADQASRGGGLETAARWGRRAVDLDPSDELSVRKLIEILGEQGNHAAAFQLYREFTDRLAKEYELEPSPETVAMMEAVRSRATSGSASADPLPLPAEQEDDRPTPDVAEEQGRVAEVGGFGETPGSVGLRSRISRRIWAPRGAAVQFRFALGLVAVGLLTTWTAGLMPLIPEGGGVAPVKSLAVLPFRSIGPGDEDHFFADAMHEEILTQLSRVRSLRVIARSSVVSVQMDVEENSAVAEKLGVEYLIRGALQISGNRIRIWARLIDAPSGEQLWASSLEGTLDNLFQIQMETAQQIAQALDRRFPDSNRRLASRPTANAGAYEAYLKGRLHSSRIINPEDARRAVQYLEEAVRLDSTFATAWAMLSYSKLLLVYQFAEDDQSSEAEIALARATSLAPNDVETWLAQAYYDSYASQDYDRALARIRQILDARPSHAQAKSLEGFVLRRMGQWTDAAAAMTAALEFDPQDYSTTVVLAEMYMRMRRFDAAEHLLDRAIAIAPSGELAYVEKALLLRDGRGDTVAAREILESAPISLSPTNRIVPAVTALYRNDLATALRILVEPTSGRREIMATDEVLASGLIRFLQGDREEAAGWAEVARERLEQKPKEAQAASATGGVRGPAIARSQYALAAALSGHEDEAVRAAERAAQMLPLSKDAYAGTDVLESLAEVYVLTGRRQDAIETLDRLLSVPSRVSVHVLRLNPLFDSLRGDPRFEGLVARYADVIESASATLPPVVQFASW